MDGAGWVGGTTMPTTPPLTISGGWVPTPVAVRALGRSKPTLLRMIKAGLLEPGKHFLRGQHANSTVTWNVEAVTETLARLSAMPAPARTADPTPANSNNI